MPPRILPDYETLRHLIVNQGTSYATIAKRYNVNYRSVYDSFRTGAEAAGESWPIKRDLSRPINAGIKESLIDSTFLREMLMDAYNEAQETFIGNDVWASQNQAVLALTEPSRVVKYHREGCYAIQVDDLRISYNQAIVRDYKPCGTCCRKFSLRAFATQIHVEQSHLSMIFNGQLPRIKKTTAIRLLKAIGEDPHPTLASWEPTWQGRRYIGKRVA